MPVVLRWFRRIFEAGDHLTAVDSRCLLAARLGPRPGLSAFVRLPHRNRAEWEIRHTPPAAGCRAMLGACVCDRTPRTRPSADVRPESRTDRSRAACAHYWRTGRPRQTDV